jgi:F-type H+-transporting ATPase subunit delta
VGALGADAESGLGCLRAVVPPLKGVPRVLSGRFAAGHVEGILRESVRESGASAGIEATVEFVIRFVAMLVERGRFARVDSVIAKIRERIDSMDGVLVATLESATPIGRDDVERFERDVAERVGAAKVRLDVLDAPELLGGYRLRIGGFYVDASLRKQIEKMRADLEAAALASSGAT